MDKNTASNIDQGLTQSFEASGASTEGFVDVTNAVTTRVITATGHVADIVAASAIPARDVASAPGQAPKSPLIVTSVHHPGGAPHGIVHTLTDKLASLAFGRRPRSPPPGNTTDAAATRTEEPEVRGGVEALTAAGTAADLAHPQLGGEPPLGVTDLPEREHGLHDHKHKRAGYGGATGVPITSAGYRTTPVEGDESKAAQLNPDATTLTPDTNRSSFEDASHNDPYTDDTTLDKPLRHHHDRSAIAHPPITPHNSLAPEGWNAVGLATLPAFGAATLGAGAAARPGGVSRDDTRSGTGADYRGSSATEGTAESSTQPTADLLAPTTPAATHEESRLARGDYDNPAAATDDFSTASTTGGSYPPLSDLNGQLPESTAIAPTSTTVSDLPYTYHPNPTSTTTPPTTSIPNARDLPTTSSPASSSGIPPAEKLSEHAALERGADRSDMAFSQCQLPDAIATHNTFHGVDNPTDDTPLKSAIDYTTPTSDITTPSTPSWPAANTGTSITGADTPLTSTGQPTTAAGTQFPWEQAPVTSATPAIDSLLAQYGHHSTATDTTGQGGLGRDPTERALGTHTMEHAEPLTGGHTAADSGLGTGYHAATAGMATGTGAATGTNLEAGLTKGARMHHGTPSLAAEPAGDMPAGGADSIDTTTTSSLPSHQHRGGLFQTLVQAVAGDQKMKPGVPGHEVTGITGDETSTTAL